MEEYEAYVIKPGEPLPSGVSSMKDSLSEFFGRAEYSFFVDRPANPPEVENAVKEMRETRDESQHVSRNMEEQE